ncbi:MAG TPA: hydantoinase/oxoprolinase family protein [Pirellulales bacterium]|jgi:probable H4MPT-linked C1 transfer pathway protein|nr:hydantoinase/oxoprolinase family protein [Pirellulales bacterium]
MSRWLALDVGGAHLKAADGLGFAASQYFPLWQKPDALAGALAALIAQSPPADRLAVTMTGELADCFATKAEGVAAILAATENAAGGRKICVYLVDGSYVAPHQALEQPLLAAASNWRALAQFAARYAPEGSGLLIDIGSTTCDLIPLVDGRPCATGHTDPERLAAGELVYTGVTRSPVCAVASALPWRGKQVPTAQELFATTWDAYLTMGELPEEPDSRHTADGRPATKQAARDRLARSICADRQMFDDADALAAATAIARAQSARLALAAQGVVRRLPSAPETIIVSGQGEFLARQLLQRMRLQARVVSLNDELGADLSRAAPAHALAALAREAYP